MIDFRSDTVTKPSKEMAHAMMEAPVGDDVFAEDPSINELEAYAADLFGMEKALFCPSGTMTNQIAIMVHTQPGDEVICHHDSHIYRYEGGGIARNSGASVRLLNGPKGMIQLSDLEGNINPMDSHFPRTSMVSLENTTNRGGGACYLPSDLAAISAFCQDKKMPLHLDGARLFNAIVRTKTDPKQYGKWFNSISICLSKGLGAPVGSLLLGNTDFIREAHRCRKVLGGGMRQAGGLAAAGLFALKNNVDRLVLDHKNAKSLADILQAQSWVKGVWPVETNIVLAELKAEECEVNWVAKLKEKGILAIPFGKKLIRFVTHLDVTEKQVGEVAELIKE
ncbi:MAG: threonine aldolase [Sphingobacteriales bacterium]|jgi:threonine aldolase